jgi:hypothetical protein
MILRDRHPWTLLVAGLAVGILLAGSACTDADVVREETSDTVVAVRSLVTVQTPFDGGTSGFSRLLVVPTDPDAAAAVDNQPFGLVATQVVFDMYGGATVEVDSSPLRPGRYRIAQLIFRLPSLTNSNPSTDPGDACIEQVDAVPGPAPIFNRSWPANGEVSLEYADDVDAPTFVVSSGEDRIDLSIDFDVFLEEYVARFQCTTVSRCFTTGAGGSVPPPCVFRFNDDADFRELVKSSIRFD